MDALRPARATAGPPSPAECLTGAALRRRENLNNGIVRGLRRRCPSVDLVRVQDIGLVGADDPAILDWAAEQGRVVLTHDVSTMTAHAYERVLAGQPMRGVIEVPRDVAVGRAIDDLALLVECAHDEEFEGQVRYLPL